MEYERVTTTARVSGILRVGWNALGTDVLIELRVGKPGSPGLPAVVAIASDLAEQLRIELNVLAAEKGREEPPAQ